MRSTCLFKCTHKADWGQQTSLVATLLVSDSKNIIIRERLFIHLFLKEIKSSSFIWALSICSHRVAHTPLHWLESWMICSIFWFFLQSEAVNSPTHNLLKYLFVFYERFCVTEKRTAGKDKCGFYQSLNSFVVCIVKVTIGWNIQQCQRFAQPHSILSGIPKLRLMWMALALSKGIDSAPASEPLAKHTIQLPLGIGITSLPLIPTPSQVNSIFTHTKAISQ